MEQTGRAEGAARHPGHAAFCTSTPAPAPSLPMERFAGLMLYQKNPLIILLYV